MAAIDRARAVAVTRTRLRLSGGARRIEIGQSLRSALEGAIAARELIAPAQETLRAQPYRDNTPEERAAREYQIELVAWQINRAADLAEKRLAHLDAITTPEQAEAELDKCSAGVEGTLHWFEYYAWGYDPRHDAPLAVQPFALFPVQDRYVRWLESLVFDRRASGLVEKARDMGATVGAVNWIVKQWRFRDGFSALLTSSTEDLIDSKKDPDTLFEKVRFQVRLLPTWMLPVGFDLDRDLTYMNIANPVNGSVITGQAPTPKVGRQRRRTVVIMDEFAIWPQGGYPQYTSLSKTAQSLLILATPMGRHNKYAEVRHSGHANVFEMDWREHPWKDQRWYGGLRPGYVGPPMTDQQVAQEIDRNYDASQPGKVFPGWREEYCLITWSELVAYYKQFKLDHKFRDPNGNYIVPDDWNWGRTTDYGQSDDHAWIVTHAARPRANYPLSDSVFVFSCHRITPTAAAVGEAQPQIEKIERELGFRDYTGKIVHRFEFSECSHEADQMRETFLHEYGELWVAWNTDYNLGIPQMQEWLMLIQPQFPNPIRPELYGRSRIYFVAPDDEYRLVENEKAGSFFVTPSRTEKGFQLLRIEMPAYHYPPSEAGKAVKDMRPLKRLDDTCLVAGTMISTARGLVPIEQVGAEDRILTRQGYKRTSGARLTSDNAEIYAVYCSDGRVIKGTSNHPVYTVERGFTPIDSLRTDDTLSMCKERWSFLTESGFTAIPTRSDGRIAVIFSLISEIASKALARCMKRYGRRLMERFLKATTFTTRTGIPSITLSTIWSACRRRIITGYMRPISLRRLPSDWSCLSAFALSLPSGIKARMGDRGTVKMAGELGPLEQPLRERANSVAHFIARRAGMGASVSALSNARVNLDTRLSLTTKIENALSALRRWMLRLTCVKSSVREAARTAQQGAARPKKFLEETAPAVARCYRRPLESLSNTVPVNVVAVIKETERQPVYNLSVEEAPEYFANGVLVHNCDTLRAFATHWGPSVAPKTAEERVEDALPEHLRAEHVQEMSQGRMLARELALAEERKKIEQEEVGEFGSFWEGLS